MPARSAFRPKRQNAPRPAWKVAEAFLQWLRGRPCACAGRNPDCGGNIQSAHVDGAGKGTADAKGLGTKVADKHAIPLSANCHRRQHDHGWPRFIAEVLMRDPVKMAAGYWNAWLATPMGKKWTAEHD